MRLRLSNAYGKAPLAVSATLASPKTGTGAALGDIDAATLTSVTFSGEPQAPIPAGAELVSDPVSVSVPDDGDQTSAASVSSFPRRTTSFWFLDGLDVQAKVDRSVAFLGDSITDGSGSTTDADHRWTDYLTDRVLDQPRPQRLGVLNAVSAGTASCSTPRALARASTPWPAWSRTC